MPQKKKLPFVTVGFVAVNVLVYVILEILGNTENSEFMVRMGAVWCYVCSVCIRIRRILSVVFQYVYAFWI